MDKNRIDVIYGIQDILQNTRLGWTISYIPSSDSYCIYISNDDGEEVGTEKEKTDD